MTEPNSARLLPLTPEQRDPTVNEMLAKLGPRAENNFFTTLARHPKAFKRWVAFGTVLLLDGDLPPRDRELLVLRVAHLCSCTYEWAHHREIALTIGLDDDEIARIREGPEHDGWSAFEATLLRAADELHVHSRISDSTWETLSQRYTDRQLIEVTAVVGMYHLTAFYVNSIGVQLESGHPA